MSFKNFNFITKRLATGGGPVTPQDCEDLVSWGITHVIDVREAADPLTGRFVAVLHNPTPDDGKAKPKEWFYKSIDFALAALLDERSTVYAHCDAGINRGPSTAYAILRAWTGMYPHDAHGLIVIHRPIDLFGLRYADDADRALKGGPYDD